MHKDTANKQAATRRQQAVQRSRGGQPVARQPHRWNKGRGEVSERKSRREGQVPVTPVRHFFQQLSCVQQGGWAALGAVRFTEEMSDEGSSSSHFMSVRIHPTVLLTSGHCWAAQDLWENLHLLLRCDKGHSRYLIRERLLFALLKKKSKHEMISHRRGYKSSGISNLFMLLYSAVKHLQTLSVCVFVCVCLAHSVAITQLPGLTWRQEEQLNRRCDKFSTESQPWIGRQREKRVPGTDNGFRVELSDRQRNMPTKTREEDELRLDQWSRDPADCD